jgi:hypothetical protein
MKVLKDVPTLRKAGLIALTTSLVVLIPGTCEQSVAEQTTTFCIKEVMTFLTPDIHKT